MPPKFTKRFCTPLSVFCSILIELIGDDSLHLQFNKRRAQLMQVETQKNSLPKIAVSPNMAMHKFTDQPDQVKDTEASEADMRSVCYTALSFVGLIFIFAAGLIFVLW